MQPSRSMANGSFNAYLVRLQNLDLTIDKNVPSHSDRLHGWDLNFLPIFDKLSSFGYVPSVVSHLNKQINALLVINSYILINFISP